VKFGDKDKTLLLHNVLLNKFEHFKDALLFEKEQSITLKEFKTSI